MDCLLSKGLLMKHNVYLWLNSDSIIQPVHEDTSAQAQEQTSHS